jgi:hypothetical protein
MTVSIHSDTAEALAVSKPLMGTATGAYAREKHLLLGVPTYAPARKAGVAGVPENVSPREAFALAGADFTVEKRPLQVVHAEDTVSPVTTHMAVVRTDTNQTVGINSKSYIPFQNEWLIRVFEYLREDATLDNILVQDNGSRIIATASLRFREDVISGDPIMRYIHAFTSHDGSTRLGFHFSDLRMVCANQCRFITGKGASQAAKDGRGLCWRHSRSNESNLEALPQLIDLENQRFHRSVEELRKLPGKQLTVEAATAILSHTYADKLAKPFKEKDGSLRERTLADLEEIDTIRSYYAGGGIGITRDLWGMFNSITQYETHDSGRANNETERARARLENLWGGSCAQRIERARTACLSFV